MVQGMTDDAPSRPNLDELLTRIARLETQVANLAGRGAAPIMPDSVAAMMTRSDEVLRQLETKVKRFGASIANLSTDFMEHRAAQADLSERIFERIRGLETTIFPNLQKDIDRLHHILGTDAVPAEQNSLDSRISKGPVLGAVDIPEGPTRRDSGKTRPAKDNAPDST